ncbi:MAG: dTDP-4-amino-4,6-dideoxygalactose transaminase [Parachlamydiales bacterium]|nr:dTDP-4-amino-4,6-dideoxygalactose transaminase [Parachlamydiales bacterium]
MSNVSISRKIPFNRPFLTGKELTYIQEAVNLGKISGDGFFTKKCHEFFQKKYGFNKALLTTSCTSALEMSAILAEIRVDDEVIMPSYTFPSTANAFVLRGAKIVFADSCDDSPNIDSDHIEELITEKTKAIVIVHYAGVACKMDQILQLASKYQLFLIEDAAHAIDSYYKGIPLGSLGHFGAFSFHETKNISSGEGGLLAINDEKFALRAEIIREKGTNRSAFFRGEVNKYGWVDMGSSFLPSDINAAFLYAQLESLDEIQRQRVAIWRQYYEGLKPLSDAGYFSLPVVPPYATNNAHLFYMICRSLEQRQLLIDFLKRNGILSVFHYLPLHSSEFYRHKHDGRNLPNCDRYSDCLLRLPLYCGLSGEEVEYIIQKIVEFYDAVDSFGSK